MVYDNKVEAEQFCVERNISRVSVSNADTGKELWKFEKETRTPDDHVYTMIHYFSKDAPDTGKMTEYKYLVKVQLSEKFNIEDKYYMIQKLSVLLYNLRFWIYPIGIISFILTIAAFIFLMCSAGRRSGSSQVQPGWGTGIPFDVTTAALGVASIAMIYVISELLYYQVAWIQWIGICAVVGVISIMCLGWIMSFAVRVKLGGWWKNTVIFYALILCWKILKACCRGIIRACKAIGNFVMMIPMVWRTTLGIAVVSIIEFIILATFWGEGDVLFVWWFIGKFIQIQLVLYIAMMLKKLKKGGDAMASGDFSYQVNTRRMIWDFKKHGNNLNSIGVGMTHAVEQRLKSERMKTELITNVSHDIKTPLTSIINYTDLICKEDCDNENIKEYADVLHRQSERLKRLIEDLVEASKASTGNLEVNLAPCEVGVMLTQTGGEYQEKLQKAQLELIISQPDTPIMIMADGRRLWRVFDNLMNNLCKYSMENTRVYLTLEERNGEAVISFKNISKAPLNLTPDELMERFIRGDVSRSTEGNGLGLSIARSLTELQKGKMEIAIDGDLFKVILRFPTMK